MAILTSEQQDKIIKALDDKGASKPCPRCGYTKLGLIDESGNIALANGRTLPFAIVFCKNCGLIFEHVLATLVSDIGELQK